MTDYKKDTGVDKALPEAFTEEMRELFQTLPGVSVSELPAFLESLLEERSYGLRRNPLKYTKEAFEKEMPFTLEKIPWAGEGYFYKKEEQPGKSPYHEAGAFYIQEPSAMIAAELLEAEPGDFVADLCAAPGGKSTQIAGAMKGEGVLVCNEYVPARAEILAQNMERMGVSGCIILKESVDRIAERLPLFFDKVLVDAPCSGAGMFRKEEQALLQWSPENVRMCAARQQEILEYAARLVKPGGALVYSTCTFSAAENEAVIEEFLENHQEFYGDETVLTKERLEAGICSGSLPGTVRMWPHKLRGEGHFAARLIREGGCEYRGNSAEQKEAAAKENKGEQTDSGSSYKSRETEKEFRKTKKDRHTKGQNAGKGGSEQENRNLFQDFCKQYINGDYLTKLEKQGEFVWRKEHLFLVPDGLPDLGTLRVVRSGLYLGEAKAGRFEPSHTWAMTLKKEEVRQWMDVKDAAGYLRGETAENEGLKGWLLMLHQGRPLGWGKAGGAPGKKSLSEGAAEEHPGIEWKKTE